MALILDEVVLDRFVNTLRKQRAPVVDWLSRGLSDADIDELIATTGLLLPEEARVWWRFSNGVPRSASNAATAIGFEKWWAPLEEVLSERARLFEFLARNGFEPGEDVAWRTSWLPFLGSRKIALDIGQQAVAPVFVVDWHDDPDELQEPLPTLRSTVEAWVLGLTVGASGYDAEQAVFFADQDKAADHGIPAGVL